MAGGQWYNYQTGQYESGEQDPLSLEAPANLVQQSEDFVTKAKTPNTKWKGRPVDNTATATPVFNPSTRSWEMETTSAMPFNSKFPEWMRKAPDKWLAGVQFSDEDPRKSGKRLVDQNAVYYDPDYGYMMHQDNYYQKKHWQDKVAKYMPSAIMALGTMGMGSAVGPLAKAGFTAGLGAMKGLSQGQKPLGVLKNAAIGAGIGYAGHLAGQALGGGFQGQLANRFVKQIPNLMNMYGGTPNLTGVSPGNVRMDQGYRPTIPTPNNYNFLRPRGR